MMAKLTRCQGNNRYGVVHHYDANAHSSCPQCGVAKLDVAGTIGLKSKGSGSATYDGTVPVGPPSGVSPRPVEPAAQDPRTVARKEGESGQSDGRTIAYRPSSETDEQQDPVVGWLVCVAGPNRGRDYRIRYGNNYIGRDPSMDICIRGDQGISSLRAGLISYEPRHRAFTVMKGEGRNLVYVNDAQVTGAQTLEAYDIIELGGTKLMFVPLCGEKFGWD